MEIDWTDRCEGKGGRTYCCTKHLSQMLDRYWDRVWAQIDRERQIKKYPLLLNLGV
jgi:hypothetical protein